MNSGPAVGTPAAEHQNQATPKENSEMKLLRYLFALTLVCALSGMAKADPIDFHMVVVDAGTPLNTIYLVPPASPVDFSFGPCSSSYGPNEDGCAYFVNSMGYGLTSLQLEFPDAGSPAAGQTPNCSPSGTGLDFFAASSCSISGNNFIINFSDGLIPNGTAFIIAEDGVPTCDGSDPWTGTLSANAPEPSSMWLMSTGVLMLGAFFYAKRRNGLGSTDL
jgi:hypothetical protein